MRYTYNINSSERQSGTNTDFDIHFSQPITPLSKYGQFIVSVSSISVPFSFYQLSATDGLNVLPVSLKNAFDPNPFVTSITLQTGNYTPYTLITQLNSRLIEKCQTPAGGFTPFTPTFNSTYNPTTGHITFVLTAPVGSEIRLLFSLTASARILSGFFGMDGTDIVMTPLATPSSVRPCLLNPVNYLFLRSSLKQYRNREWTIKPDDVSDIIYRVPIGTNQGTWIQYDQPSEPVYIVDSSISSINFYLTSNLSYTGINLQGLAWSFAFSISEVVRVDYVPITEALASNKLARLSMEERDKMIEELDALKQREILRLQKYKEKLEKTKGDVPASQETPVIDPQKTTSPSGVEYSSGSHLMEYTPSIPYANINVFDNPQRRPDDAVLQEIPP